MDVSDMSDTLWASGSTFAVFTWVNELDVPNIGIEARSAMVAVVRPTIGARVSDIFDVRSPRYHTSIEG
jgi:hypothetical protein